MYKVNIVVPTYNGVKFLNKMYASLKDSISPEADIKWTLTLVDDGSIDDTSQWAKANPEVRYIRSGANLGFSHACNAGAAADPEADWILFLNNDTEPQNGFLEEMLKSTEHFTHPQIVGSKLLYANTTLIQHAGIRFMANGYPYEYGQGKKMDDDECNRAGLVQAVTAACMLIDKNLFALINGFDEEYINGW